MNLVRFNYLLETFKTGQLTPSEQTEWSNMIQSEDYRPFIEQDIEASITDFVPDIRWTTTMQQDTWENILSDSNLVSAQWVSPRPIPGMARYRRLLIAVAAACILAALGIVWFNSFPSSSAVKACVTRTDRGSKKVIFLPDGTKVWLDAGSSLTSSAGFSIANREVVLAGQGYFEVEPNSSLPFIVKTAGQLVEALGTRFNIDAYPGDVQTRTTLLQGSVRVSYSSDSLQLQPGQAAVSDAGKSGLRCQAADTSQITAWKNNLFSFKGTLLRDVMGQLERWYNVQMLCGPAADTLKVTGHISRQNPLPDVLKMLAYTSGILYSIDGRIVHLGVVRAHASEGLPACR